MYSVANPGKNLKVAWAHKEGVTGVGWVVGEAGEEGERVVSGGGDGAVKVWGVKLV